ncbi:Fip1-domain-containing protein [Agrocybe pediades]|nr:Fip1-domain-containing protein [Agrocybe pediades]
MEPVARSLDLRAQNKPSTTRSVSASTPSQPRAPQPSLTTEYTPIQRGGPPPTSATPTQHSHSESVQQHPAAPATASQPSQSLPHPQQQQHQEQKVDDGIDTSTLPPVTKPPSHPDIDPNQTGIFDGRSILEVDINALADKPWRRPGSDISDWFNYGFDEISWEAYCYRRRDLGEMANVLKTNVINFAAMPEDQLVALPPELRTMVMTGANAMMNNATANPMMPGMMMDMSNMVGMGMGMNGDMGMGNPMMQGMMGADGGQGQQAGMGINGTPEHVNGVGMMQEGFNPAAAGGMMNMGMGGDFMQSQMGQQMYPGMDQQAAAAVSAGRGTPVPSFRGGGRGVPLGSRGRGFPGGRGRGRGYGEAAPPVPVRPASPLPPGVPTGPRNQNKYKDRDGNAPAVDGLDYGGGKEGGSRRTPSGEPEERISSSRKRRSSPGLDDSRSSKRR